MNHPFSRRLAATALIVAAVLGLAACSSDDGATTTTTTPSDESTTTNPSNSPSAETIRFDASIQQQLADVGCHPGPVDGQLGPRTDAAIVAFQEAAGIEVDGELGPQTDTALREAAADKKTVCTTASTTTARPATTTTRPTSAEAPCTATALLEGLPAENETISSYICSSGYAAGTLSDGTTKFILQSEDGQWVAPSQVPCGSASAGLPPAILQDGCPS